MNRNFDFGFTEDNSSPYIFISYRRADSKQFVARLYEHVTKDFHESQVFLDTRSINLAERFDDVIERKVKSCKVLIVVIGNKWLTTADANGQRRLLDPNDWVRREIATALSRNTSIIPVLIENATMPAKEDLPDELHTLCQWQAIEVSESCFDCHMNVLRKAIERTIPFEERLLNAYHDGKINAFQVQKLSNIPLEHREEYYEKALMQAPILEEIEQETRAQIMNDIIAALKNVEVSKFRCTCVLVEKAENRIETVLDCALVIPKNSVHSNVLSKGWVKTSSGRYTKAFSYQNELPQNQLVDIAGDIIAANGFAGVGVRGVYVSFPLDNENAGATKP